MITDQEIIEAMQRNPEKGFRLLMTKYKEPVYWYIRRLLISYDDAQDVTQETFVRVFRSFSQHQEGCSLAAWIYRIATNETFRFMESRREKAMSLDEMDEGVVCLLADEYVDYTDLETVKLQQAIHALPPKQQVVFNLRYYDELGYDEIAAVLDSTVSGAKMNYHLAKEKIVDYMNAHD